MIQPSLMAFSIAREWSVLRRSWRRSGPRRAGRQGRWQAGRHQLLDRARRDLAIVTDKDADGLEIIRHSTAHLLAYAVKELFPEAQVTIGPVIENGFYYDFRLQASVHAGRPGRIEKRMANWPSGYPGQRAKSGRATRR
jgi:hypothetical protein